MQYGNFHVKSPGYPLPVHFSFQLAPPITSAYSAPSVYYPGHGINTAFPYAAGGWSAWGLWNHWSVPSR